MYYSALQHEFHLILHQNDTSSAPHLLFWRDTTSCCPSTGWWMGVRRREITDDSESCACISGICTALLRAAFQRSARPAPITTAVQTVNQSNVVFLAGPLLVLLPPSPSRTLASPHSVLRYKLGGLPLATVIVTLLPKGCRLHIHSSETPICILNDGH